MTTTILLIGIALCGGAILTLQDWRYTFSALLLNYILIAIFMVQDDSVRAAISSDSARFSLMLIKLITGFSATVILSITALTFSREYNLEDLDEFSLAELRRAARRVQTQSAGVSRRFSDYVVPFWALVLAALASIALPRLYPIGSYALDFTWYWLGLIGLFAIVSASDLLKVGLGLLLCVESMALLYMAVSGIIQVVPLALLSLTTVVLALAIAYLSGLLYGRLKTLELNELYKS